MSELTPKAKALRERLAVSWLRNHDVDWFYPVLLGRYVVAGNIARTIVEELGITEEMLSKVQSVGMREEYNRKPYGPAVTKAHGILSTLLELAGEDHGE